MAPLTRNPVTTDDEKAKAAAQAAAGAAASAADGGETEAGNSAPGSAADNAGQPAADMAREQGSSILEQGSPAVRRNEKAEKVMQQQVEQSPAQQLDYDGAAPKPAAGLRNVQNAAPVPDEIFMFMSEYKDLQIYVDLGHTERDKDGRIIPRNYPVKFRNGIFKTTLPQIAAAIRQHPRCGTKSFREELNAKAVALRAAAAAARDNLRAPSFAGPTSSSDGQDALFHQHDNELQRAEQQMFSL